VSLNIFVCLIFVFLVSESRDNQEEKKMVADKMGKTGRMLEEQKFLHLK
jgi:hypothetical protein